MQSQEVVSYFLAALAILLAVWRRTKGQKRVNQTANAIGHSITNLIGASGIIGGGAIVFAENTNIGGVAAAISGAMGLIGGTWIIIWGRRNLENERALKARNEESARDLKFKNDELIRVEKEMVEIHRASRDDEVKALKDKIEEQGKRLALMDKQFNRFAKVEQARDETLHKAVEVNTQAINEAKLSGDEIVVAPLPAHRYTEDTDSDLQRMGK